MSDALQALARPLDLKDTLFGPTSRYHGLDTATLKTAEGKTVIYLRRRFVPQPERLTAFQEHTVVEGDRLDNLAARYLGEPELSWRLCDANAAMNPGELTQTVGRALRIALPEGMPGTGNA